MTPEEIWAYHVEGEERYLGTYPVSPGVKSGDDTTIAAALAIEPVAAIIREKVMALLVGRNLTTDEAATMLGLSVLSVRPRFSELRMLGKVFDTGERRKNSSGRYAIVWTSKQES